MAVKIRLKRMGSKNNPFFRIVVADTKSPRDGRFIEQIGTYDPKVDGSVTVDKDRADYWIGKGAKPSDTVRVLLKKQGLSNR